MRIHILGASGSGTTTLGAALSKKLNYPHYDTDDYFWKPSDPPFQEKRLVEDRYELLDSDLSIDHFVLSGSLCGWGDPYIEKFDLVVYLHIPKDLRMKRLISREKMRYGSLVEKGGSMHQSHIEFIAWAERYDTAGLEQRSYQTHLHWLKSITCPVIKIDGAYSLEEIVEKVLEVICEKK